MHKAVKPAWQALLLCLGFLTSAFAQEAVPEQEVKFAMTYKVTRFVQWPKTHANRQAFHFCVFADNPFEDALSELTGRKVQTSPIQALITDDLDVIRHQCQLLYIPEGFYRDIPQILAAVRTQSILTISDTEGFANHGGIIELHNTDNRIGFRINIDAYRQTGLEISSQLLQIADLVVVE